MSEVPLCGGAEYPVTGEGVIFDPQHVIGPYRGTSLIRNQPPLGPFSRAMHRVLR